MVMPTGKVTELDRQTLDRFEHWPLALELMEEEPFVRLQGRIGTQQHPRGLARREESQGGCGRRRTERGRRDEALFAPPACFRSPAAERAPKMDVGSCVSARLNLLPQHERVVTAIRPTRPQVVFVRADRAGPFRSSAGVTGTGEGS